MATVIDVLGGPDGREVELTIEPGQIVLTVRSPDHAQPERASLTWDEFDAATDRLRAWRQMLAPRPAAGPDSGDDVAAFVAALAER